MSGGEALHVQKKTRSVFRVWKLRRKFVLCFTEFPILSLLLKGIHCGFFPEDRRNFPWSLFCWFFVYKNSSCQAEKTFPRYTCSEELYMLKVLCLGPNQDQALRIPTVAQLLKDQKVFFSMISPSLGSISTWETCLVLLVFERKVQEASELQFWLWSARLWLSTSPSKTLASQERCHVQTPVWGRIIYRALILNAKDW